MKKLKNMTKKELREVIDCLLSYIPEESDVKDGRYQ